MTILDAQISDKRVQLLMYDIIHSYHGQCGTGNGLPLGNLTSQLFSNVYMDVFDQWVKHDLKQKYYIRYADDFVFLSQDKNVLRDLIVDIRSFLWDTLQLELHPDKIILKTFSSGVDFLGWVHFPHHAIPRKKNQRADV